MSKFMLPAVLITCALLCAPAMAQNVRRYQAPDAAELEQLRNQPRGDLAEVRGGDATRKVALTRAERETLAALQAALPRGTVILQALRGGGWGAVEWVGYVAVPCTCATIVFWVVFIIVLFL